MAAFAPTTTRSPTSAPPTAVWFRSAWSRSTTPRMWIVTRVYPPGSDALLATMILNSAVLKDSYANYESERALNPVDGSR